MSGAVAFGGYAAVFDRVDRAGDVIKAGAFTGCALVPLLLQHRGAPVGRLSSIAQDARGVRVEGVVDDRDVARLVRAGAITGLSVGYCPRVVRQSAWREIRRADLVEISLVAVPMQPAARVDTLRDAGDPGASR